MRLASLMRLYASQTLGDLNASMRLCPPRRGQSETRSPQPRHREIGIYASPKYPPLVPQLPKLAPSLIGEPVQMAPALLLDHDPRPVFMGQPLQTTAELSGPAGNPLLDVAHAGPVVDREVTEHPHGEVQLGRRLGV